jgi:predicted permease
MDFNALLATFANNLLPILLLSGAGFLLGKAVAIDSRALGRVVFYVFSPILVFNLLLHVELNSGDLRHHGLRFLVSAVGGLLAFGRQAMRLSARCSWLGHHGLCQYRNFTGFPYPSPRPQALAFASPYFVTTSICSIPLVLLASLGHMDSRPPCRALPCPAVYAVILAALLNRFDVALPLSLARTIDLAASGSIPLMIVLLGVELSRVTWSHSMKPVGLSVGLRLIAGPVIGLLLAIPFGLQGDAYRGNVTQTGMPAAVTNMVLAAEYGLDTSLVTAMVFLGTILSPLTLTPLLVFLGN